MKQRDRLIELIKKAETEFANSNRPVLDIEEFVADYILENGGIVPPCKVGDTVYYISLGKIYKGKCHAITQHDDRLQIHLYDYDGDNASYSSKDVFLSREEAEKALERSKR